MRTEMVIFDLDGTLLDTVGDLAAACNVMLARRGLDGHTLEEYRRFVGNGILRLVERALPETLRTPEYVASARADFVDYYIGHIDRCTLPYAGIAELLTALEDLGVRLAVVSNKFQQGTEKLIGRFFPTHRFEVVFGQREGVPLKPHPAAVNEILARTGVERERVLYVGDSGIDIEMAHAASIRSVGATWGFRPRAELEEAGAGFLADEPASILTVL